MECGISKQAHAQLLDRLEYRELMTPLYLGMILEVRRMHPAMGLRTIYSKVKPERIGRDAFIALGVQAGLSIDKQPIRPITTRVHASVRYRNLLCNKVFNNINQIWSSDITYFKLRARFYYIVLVMDVYSRRILGYSLSDNLRAENNVAAIRMALEIRAIDDYANQLIHHSDRGSQYVSRSYTEILDAHHISISMCQNVYENAHLERVNGTIKNQYLKNWKITNEYELKGRLDHAIYAYNYDRPHQALEELSPVEYEHTLQRCQPKQHKRMKIYTIDNRSNEFDPSQMTIF